MLAEDILQSAKILIVDDEPENVKVLKLVLQTRGYTKLTCTSDSRQALSLFEQSSPDLVLLDLHMPHLDGFAVLAQIRSITDDGEFLPILVLTADATPETKIRALTDGAKDFLLKPFDATEILLRTTTLLTTRFLYQQVQHQNRTLDQRVRERTLELERAQIEMIERLAAAAEYRDDATGEHIHRVGYISELLSEALGFPASTVELLGHAAPLHDVGKIGIPDHILLKPGHLTPDEFEVMKTHTGIGARMLSGSQSELLKLAEEIALTHHEHWDGRGYYKLSGDQIPISSRIVAVADAFDVLTHSRPYKPAVSPDAASAEIECQSGSQFDPKVVSAFVAVRSDISKVVAPIKRSFVDLNRREKKE